MGHLVSKDAISLYVSIHQSLDVTSTSSPLIPKCISPPPYSCSLCHPLELLRSLIQSPPSTPPRRGFLQRVHRSPAGTDRHLRELHWFLCVNGSVQQQGSHCEIRLHAGANWTQGSLTCIVDHARYLAYLNLLIRSRVCFR